MIRTKTLHWIFPEDVDLHFKIYDDIGIPHRCVRGYKQGFGEQLKGIIEYVINHKPEIVKENQNINMQLEKQNNIYMNEIKRWLEKTILYSKVKIGYVFK